MTDRPSSVIFLDVDGVSGAARGAVGLLRLEGLSEVLTDCIRVEEHWWCSLQFRTCSSFSTGSGRFCICPQSKKVLHAADSAIPGSDEAAASLCTRVLDRISRVSSCWSKPIAYTAIGCKGWLWWRWRTGPNGPRYRYGGRFSKSSS